MSFEDSIFGLIKREEERQSKTLMMIPSENYTSPAVREAVGSVLMHKYAEGYPGKRYYQGNKIIDEIENTAIERAKTLFGVKYVNVQAHSGSPANQAIYFALCKPGDTVMGMHLHFGGHLTHGWKVNFSGKVYRSVQYTLDPRTERFDFDEIRNLALKHKPKVIWVGATAYPLRIEYEKFAEIAREAGSYLVADISHLAGLIAGGAHPSPVGYADVIMTTTHKTLRGPRGAIIMCQSEELAKKIDYTVFPGLQGGPHENNIAGIAVCLKEATEPGFKDYARQVVKNSRVLAENLKNHGFRLVGGGTENHLVVINLNTGKNKFLGKSAAEALEEAGIIVNYSTVPFDERKANDPSGIRLGTPAITTRGMKEEEMNLIAGWTKDVIENEGNEAVCREVRNKVEELCKKFPVF